MKVKSKSLRNNNKGFTLIELMTVISIGLIVAATIAGVVVGINASAKKSTGQSNAAELTSLYYKADASGVAGATSAFPAAVCPPNGIQDSSLNVTYKMPQTFTPASYSWDSTSGKFTYISTATAP